MVFTNLDIICRRYLLDKSLPIHYYSEALFHASTCLRELTIEALKVINTRSLPVNSYGAADLPDDYLDDVMVGFDGGLTIQPIPHKPNMNPIRVHNATTGEFTRQATTTELRPDGLFFPFVGWTWYWNMSEYGEPTGRLYGANGGNPNGYSIFKERRQLQLYGEQMASGSILLQYISDGQSVDAASMVDTQAFSTIQAFIIWKSSKSADNQFSPEGNQYTNQRRKLRARVSDLTGETIKDVLHKNYTAAMKN